MEPIPIILNPIDLDVNLANIPNRRQELIDQIEKFTLEILTDLTQGKSIKIKIRNRNRFDNFYMENEM